MADDLDRAHIAAGMDRLRAAGLDVYPDAEGNTPLAPAPPYVRVYPYIERTPDAAGNAADGASKTWTTRWLCHCVGANEYAAASVAMQVDRALRDFRPTIATRNCGLIRQDFAAPPTRDETTGPALFDAVAVYRLTTTA